MANPFGDNPQMQMGMQMLMPMMQQMLGGEGWEAGPPFGGMNPAMWQRMNEQSLARQSAQSMAAADIANDWIPLAQAAMPKGEEWTDAHSAQIEEMSKKLAMAMPMLSSVAPDAIDAFGPRASTWSAAGDFSDIFHEQGMSGQDAALHGAGAAQQLAQDMFGDEDSTEHRGFSMSDFGAWVSHGHQTGAGPANMEAGTLRKFVTEQAGAHAATRDIFGAQNVQQSQDLIEKFSLGGIGTGAMGGEEVGQHIRTLRELGISGGLGRTDIERMQKLGGIQAFAGDVAQRMGGERHFGQEAALHAGSFAAGMRKSGIAGEDFQMAGVSRDKIMQQDALMAVKARQSRGFNELAATMRLGGEGGPGFREGTQGAAMYEALQKGDRTYKYRGREFNVQEGNIQSILGSSLKGPNAAKVAGAALFDEKANEESLDQEGQENLTNIVRDQQWENDISPLLQRGANMGVARLNTGLGNQQIAAVGRTLVDTARNFNVDPKMDADEAKEARLAQATEALTKMGLRGPQAREIASAGLGGAEQMAGRMNFESLHHAAIMHSKDVQQNMDVARDEARGLADNADEKAAGYSKMGRRFFDAIKAGADDPSAKNFLRRLIGYTRSDDAGGGAAGGGMGGGGATPDPTAGASLQSSDGRPVPVRIEQGGGAQVAGGAPIAVRIEEVSEMVSADMMLAGTQTFQDMLHQTLPQTV